jgi:hypothetical protein
MSLLYRYPKPIAILQVARPTYPGPIERVLMTFACHLPSTVRSTVPEYFVGETA